MMGRSIPGASLRTASPDDVQQVFDLVQETIREVYPLYYPAAVVRFFSGLHSLEAVSADIAGGAVLVLEDGGAIAGTGTLAGNHVTRVFVRPGSQGCGIGTALLGALEAKAAEAGFESVVLDSSLPAARFYGRRGYAVTAHEEHRVMGSDGQLEAILVYAVMEKGLPV
ncbi:MAG: GNAT family N-acetyltransferase [Coriobacteriales bacterium]